MHKTGHYLSGPQQFVVFHEVMVIVGMTLFRHPKPCQKKLVAGFFRQPVHRLPHGPVAAKVPTPQLGIGHYGMGRGSPQLLRTLEMVSRFKFSFRFFQEVLGRLHVFVCQYTYPFRLLRD